MSAKIKHISSIISGFSKPQITFAITGNETIVANKITHTGIIIFQPVRFVLRAKRIAIIVKAKGIIEAKTRLGIKPIILSSSPILIKEMELQAIIMEIKAEIKLVDIFILFLIKPSGTYCISEIARCDSFLVQIIPPIKAENNKKCTINPEDAGMPVLNKK